VGHAIDRAETREWAPSRRNPEDVREVVELTETLGLEQSRARLWRLPPGTRNRRHVERAQEEVFVVLSGTLTLLVGDPAERLELGPGSVAAVHIGTPMQVRNEGPEPLELLAWGAPPVAGQAELLDDVELPG
jgi:mannose-6-phosphate isomerase-like protein (cupin superfamily)